MKAERNLPRTILFLFIMTGMLSGASALAATITVTSLNDSGIGSLRAAILQANQNNQADVIVFQNGLFGTIVLAASLPVILADVAIAGPTAGPGITIDGGNRYQVFNIAGTAAMDLFRLTVQNGLAFEGGGWYVGAGQATMTECTVSGNTATGRGGGIFVGTGSLSVLNSTITGNRANLDGGGIFCAGGRTNVSFVTISGNTADNDSTGTGMGGGLMRESGAVVRIRNSIVAGNLDGEGVPDCSDNGGSGNLNTLGGNLIGDNSGCARVFVNGLPNFQNDYVGTSTNPLNPKLGALGDNGGPTPTRSLLTDSPAIGAVPVGGCLDLNGNSVTNDQRGSSRPLGSLCDAGAYEGGSSSGGGGGNVNVGSGLTITASGGCFVDTAGRDAGH